MELINRHLIMTRHIGVHGNLFGGQLMAWVDEAAGGFANEYCGTPHMVTLKVGEFLFKEPLKVGNQINIYAEVERVGNTSITLKIDVKKLDVWTSEMISVCTTDFVFVHIDETGKPALLSQQPHDRYLQEHVNDN